jgi:hypothetical protein
MMNLMIAVLHKRTLPDYHSRHSARYTKLKLIATISKTEIFYVWMAP